jgi:hypothetical protein
LSLEGVEGDVLYLDGMVVEPKLQGRGLFKQVNLKQLGEKDYRYFILRTQSPVVYAAVEGLKPQLGPDCSMEIFPGQSSPDETIRKVALCLAKDELKMKDFNAENFVGKGTFGQSLYGTSPYHPRTSRFFGETLGLDIENGDSVLVVSRFKRRGEKK